MNISSINNFNFADNWYFIVAAILIILLCVYGIASGNAIHWLRYGVSLAEKDLGSGTGQLKLHKVYDMFVERFPFFAKIVPFFVFSDWVDLALDWMREQLDKNPNIKNAIEGEVE